MYIKTLIVLKRRFRFNLSSAILTALVLAITCFSSVKAQEPDRYSIIDNQGKTTAISYQSYLNGTLELDGDVSFTLSDNLSQKRFDFLLKIYSTLKTGAPGAIKSLIINDQGRYGGGKRDIQVLAQADGGKRVIFSGIAARTSHYTGRSISGYWEGFATITMDFNRYNFLNAMSVDFIRSRRIHNPLFVEGRICNLYPPLFGDFRLRKQR